MSDVQHARIAPAKGAAQRPMQFEPDDDDPKLSWKKLLPAPDDPAAAEVVYVPGDGDPNKVTWNGVEFRANVPVKLPCSKTVDVPIRVERYTNEGDLRSQAVEKKLSMVKLAKKNPSFMVDGVQQERKVGTACLPVDNDRYRGYAIAWIRDAMTRSQLDTRWDAEAPLRERCGCDSKDVAWIMPFLEARREEVKQVG